MKIYKYISYLFIPCLVLGTLLLSSCEEEEPGGTVKVDGSPEVHYVRVADPARADSLLAGASLGNTVVIVGNNLADTRSVWFNDQEATLIPTWVTNTTVFATVPNAAPQVVTDKIYLINSVSDTLTHDFEVVIAAPRLDAAKNEWPLEGENLVIQGDFFFEPATVTFAGGVQGNIVAITQTEMEVTVPDGAVEGPVEITTNFGTGVSPFMVWDSRNIFLNFDDLVGNGWRTGLTENSDGPVNGNYLVVRGDIEANQRSEGEGASPLLMEHWGVRGTRPEGNFYPGFSTDYNLKFEAKVNAWYGGYLNICLAPWSHNDSNQEIWSNDLNARAIWGPWDAEGANFETDGWVTVVIPMDDFKYYMGTDGDGNVVYTDGAFVESAAGSMSTWLLGSPENDGSFVEFYMDNLRIVEK